MQFGGRFLSYIACAFVLSAFYSASAHAQDVTDVGAAAVDGMRIQRVDIQGLETVSEAFVRRTIKTRDDRNFLRQQVEDDVRELMRTRKFINVYANTYVEGDAVIVVFVVREKPTLKGVLFVGADEMKDSKLTPLLPASGGPVDRYEIDRARDEMLRLYREEGYYYAEVAIDEDLLRDESRVVYRITEGPRVKIVDVEFEGATSLPESKLRGVIETAKYVPIFRKGAFDEEKADRDAVALEQLYRAEGYLDARAGYRLEFDEADRTKLSVVFVAEEGPLYHVSEVQIDGAQAFEPATLEAELKLAAGMAFRDEWLQLDLKTLRDLYGEIGYVQANIESRYEFLDAPELIRLHYVIDEGKRSKVGRVTVRGNKTTKDYVVRRELRLYPGEDFNTIKMREGERRLMETSLFSRAQITPLDDVDGFREALVEVEETDAVLFLIGVGISTDSGVLGSISLTHRNFDLFDWPRTWGEFFRGKAFRGGGQTFRLQAEPGTEMTRFRVDFTEPYFLDMPLQFGTSFYLWDRGRDSYNERRYGGNISLSRRFESGPLNGWAVEGALRLEGVRINEVEPLAAREIREAEGTHYLSSVKGTIVRDTTDSRFRPTEGYRLSFSWEQFGVLGGDYTFAQPSVGAAWYRTMRTDILDRKSVLAVRGDVSYIVGDAPMFERYYAGGFNSLRGFEFRGVSPRNGILDDAIGGDLLVLTRAEYSFPIYGKNIVGVTFLDMGTVEESFTISGWRATVGLGLRVYVDFFGPIPIVLDFGFPIAKEEDDETQVFNFSFGAAF